MREGDIDEPRFIITTGGRPILAKIDRCKRRGSLPFASPQLLPDGLLGDGECSRDDTRPLTCIPSRKNLLPEHGDLLLRVHGALNRCAAATCAVEDGIDLPLRDPKGLG